MIGIEPHPRVTWIRVDGPRPLCDVPWLGTSVIQSDGSVNFCCFSSAVAGNVNQASFQEIWHGQTMRRIRQSLVDQRLPEECRSSSCPIFRGDDQHYLFDRMDGPHRYERTGTHDPHCAIRERFAGTKLVMSRQSLRLGGTLKIVLQVRYQGEPVSADLFVGIETPQGVSRFLPDGDDYAVPFFTALELGEIDQSREILLLKGRVDLFDVPGRYEVCAALFEPDSNPTVPSNCYWADSVVMTVKPVHPLVALGRRVSAAFRGWAAGDREATKGGSR